MQTGLFYLLHRRTHLLEQLMLHHLDSCLAVASADLGKAYYRSTCDVARTLGLVRHIHHIS